MSTVVYTAPEPDPLEEIFAEERQCRQRLDSALAKNDALWIWWTPIGRVNSPGGLT